MRSQRKDEHVALALKQPRQDQPFQKMRLKHHSIPDYDVSDIDLTAHYLGHTFDYPFYINAMTGGSEYTRTINEKLAKIAAQYGLAMAVGSQHVALDDAAWVSSFSIVRTLNPKGFLMANVNCNATVEEAQRAVSMIQANALQIHVNASQELTMLEGDRTFKHWISRIQDIVRSIDVPVLVKEVGNGLDYESVQKLKAIGVQHVDVSGRGGTNFIWIEDQRRDRPRYSYLNDWGMTAIEALVDNQPHMNDIEFLASGGVRTPLDVVKLLVLGASGVGISSLFLEHVIQDNPQSVAQFIEDLKYMMILVNRCRVQDLKTVEYDLKDRVMWRAHVD